jgi:hypothetical protein
LAPAAEGAAEKGPGVGIFTRILAAAGALAAGITVFFVCLWKKRKK